MLFLDYHLQHKAACLAIFESNTPRYFAPQEKDKFVSFLNRTSKSFFVVMNTKDEPLACGGYSFNDDKTIAWLRWGMVQSSLHQRGLGTYLTLGRMALLCKEEQLESIRVGTSQHTYLFHEKLGFEIYRITKNGIAPDIDEYLLDLKLDKAVKNTIRDKWQILSRTA